VEQNSRIKGRNVGRVEQNMTNKGTSLSGIINLTSIKNIMTMGETKVIIH
jgi:hypothetical protein